MLGYNGQAATQRCTSTFNWPTSNEVAVIITGAEDDTNTALERQVLIHERGGGVTAIPSHHSSYDPLAYVLTHMHADKGWTYDIPLYELNSEGNGVVQTKTKKWRK